MKPPHGALVVLLSFVGAFAVAASDQQSPVFRTGVDVVRVDVLVTDRGLPLLGLTAADFEIYDNGVRQEVQLAASAQALKLILVLDTSGSVAGERLEHLKAASRAVLGATRPGDTAVLLTFSERLGLHRVEGDNPAALAAALDRVGGQGRTAVRDALFTGLAFAAPDTARSLLLLFTDGLDNSSWLSPSSLLDAVKHSQVVVYAVDASSTVVGSHILLEDVAAESGGEHILASEKSLARAFLDVLERFRARYLLTYTAQGVGRNDGWHRLNVKLKNRQGKVRARSGYFAR